MDAPVAIRRCRRAPTPQAPLRLPLRHGRHGRDPGRQPADQNYAAKADHAPEAKYVPQDYAIPPGPSAAVQAVSGMGVHLVGSSDTSLVPGAFDFTQIVINGTWDGRYTFVEPMITRDWLLSKPTSEKPLKQPQAYQKTSYFPTTYAVHLDQQTND